MDQSMNINGVGTPLPPREEIKEINNDFEMAAPDAVEETMAAPTSQYEDLTLECRDCGNPFVFTAGEREWFAAHNFVSPARCPRCRKASKEQIADGDRQQVAPRFNTSPMPYPMQSLPYQGNIIPNNLPMAANPAFNFGNHAAYNPGFNQSESSGFTYRTYCRRCGSEARVPYTGRSNQPILCRVCRDPNAVQNLAN